MSQLLLKECQPDNVLNGGANGTHVVHQEYQSPKLIWQPPPPSGFPYQHKDPWDLSSMKNLSPNCIFNICSSQTVVSRPTASTGNWVEMQHGGSHPRPMKSQTGLDPAICVLTSLPGDSNACQSLSTFHILCPKEGPGRKFSGHKFVLS